jgi:signal peptidase II
MVKLTDYTWLMLLAGVLVLDQLTKALINSWIDIGARLPLLPFLSLTNHINTGAGFGILKDSNLLLLWIAVMAVIAIAWYMPNAELHDRAWLGVLLGGIAGNLVDRLIQEGVTDFILFFVGRFSWPSFNVADMAITASILVLVLRKR